MSDNRSDVPADISNEHVLELPASVEKDLASDIEKQGAYVSPDVMRVKVVGGRLRYTVRPGGNAGEAKKKMERYVDLMVSKFRRVPHKTLHVRKRQEGGNLRTQVYQELLRRGWVTELGRGQVALSGPALRALRAVDLDCRRIGTEQFGASEVAYPTLIPASTLARCGYFASFPHSVSMVSHLIEDIDIIAQFQAANSGVAELRVPDHTALATPEACLSPAVCYHCYSSLSGHRISEAVRVTTMIGKCFRYESANITGLDRLWDFTMREVVFVGVEEEVSRRREMAIELVKAQMERWDVAGTIETANDPFFSATYATKAFYQARGDLKYELRLAIEPGEDGAPRDLACASLNLHENFFGTVFDITTDPGAPAFTGCVAWGLERWVLALFAQHGFEQAEWPEALRSKVWAPD